MRIWLNPEGTRETQRLQRRTPYPRQLDDYRLLRLGLPRYASFGEAPRQWRHDMAIIDQIARHYETMELALIVQGASLSMIGKVLGGGRSRGSQDEE